MFAIFSSITLTLMYDTTNTPYIYTPPNPSLSHSPKADLDIVLQAVNNTNSQNLIQKPIDAEINLVNLREVVVKVNLVHLGSTAKARAARSNNIVVLIVAREDHSASTGHISRALDSKQRAAKVEFLQIESAAVFGGNSVVTAAGQIADDAEDGDVGLALRVKALAFEELLGQAEGVVGELLVGTDFLGWSGGVIDGDIVELFQTVSLCCWSFERTGLTSAIISELWALDCAGKALAPRAATQEARRNLEAVLENILVLIEGSVLLEMLRRFCFFNVITNVLMSRETSALLYRPTAFFVPSPGTVCLTVTSSIRVLRQTLVGCRYCRHQRGFPLRLEP